MDPPPPEPTEPKTSDEETGIVIKDEEVLALQFVVCGRASRVRVTLPLEFS